MFPNLNAEQARYGHSNQFVADFLRLSRCSYESKKRNGKFSMDEINKLCDFYKCDYKYLFNLEPIVPCIA